MNINRREFIAAAMASALGGTRSVASASASSHCWYKGMLHCHSYVSDGRAFPEQAVAAYRDLGYDFMSLTDHNRLQMHTEEWRVVCEKEGGWPPNVIPLYTEDLKKRFHARTRQNARGQEEARLTPYAELIEHFNVPGAFLVMPGCEITRGTGDWSTGRQIHMNYVGLDDVIPSARYGGLAQCYINDHTPAKLIRATYEETELLARAKGKPPHIFVLNHPQWPYYDVLPDDLIANPAIRFFEVCNNAAELDAPPELWRFGGYDNDRFWDVVNAFRARAGQPLLYAIATDDAHWYVNTGATTPEFCQSGYSGDGYIRVRAPALTAAALFAAMERGDFYASCGLDLDDVSFDGQTLRVRIGSDALCRVRGSDALGSGRVRVVFIVTKRGFDDRVVESVTTTKTDKMPYVRTLPIHSDEIGRVAKVCTGECGKPLEAAYTLAADDLYVRARIESDALSPFARWHRTFSPHTVGHPKCATAWTQPYTRLTMG